MMSQRLLKELVLYVPETGVFYWKERSIKHFKSSDKYPVNSTMERWNKRYANTRAGCAFCPGGKRIQEKIGIFKRFYASHRLAWLYVYGCFPKDEIDHIDGNPMNNAIENLRDVTSQENKKNMCKPVTNTSGSIGVGWRKCRGKWRATISVNNKALHLGYFNTFEEACNSRKIAEIKYKYHKNHGRNTLAM